jgi:hypothetical protein
MQPARSARTVTVRKTPDLSGITLRRADTVLGYIARIGNDTAEWLAGNFIHTPAYSEHAELFEKINAALAADDAATAEAAAREIEVADVHVHHGGHDMRIDDPLSVRVVKGQVRFRASPAFQTLRNGGL